MRVAIAGSIGASRPIKSWAVLVHSIGDAGGPEQGAAVGFSVGLNEEDEAGRQRVLASMLTPAFHHRLATKLGVCRSAYSPQ